MKHSVEEEEEEEEESVLFGDQSEELGLKFISHQIR